MPVERARAWAGPPTECNIAAQGFRELQEGQHVEFDVTQGQKGPQAENIRVI
ncbi:cold shock domain-containing protein [Streptomyces mirabilis]|uniref:cold shock domain-containing protein n=1 Tax=Streptomyces mirabilis TaxID=68239 RepID=UPI0033B6CFFC